jgi:hypothetical protein
VVIQGSLSCIPDCHSPLPPSSYILLPPFEHPFCVINSIGGRMTLLYVDHSVRTVQAEQSLFVHLTNPNLAMPSYFRAEKKAKESPLSETLLTLKATDFFDFDAHEFASYFARRFSDDGRPCPDEAPQSRFEFGEPTVSLVVDEQVLDTEARKALHTSLGSSPIFPSHRCHVRLIIASFLSFFRFDFGFSHSTAPQHGQQFCGYSYVQYERLGIPPILVNCHGGPREVPADAVWERWERERLLPISGPKDAQFVVFCQNDLPRAAVKTYFNEFCHIYRLFGFGNLSPLPTGESFFYEATEALAGKIEEFFRSQPLSEFQTYPTLSFIVAPPIHDAKFNPNSIINYVRPWSVTSGSTDEIRTLAIVVYSRTRLFAPSPFGMIDIARYETAMLFFGFRYQPPYLLRRAGDGMTMHIAWDPVNRLAAWMDDIGSVLHVLPHTSLESLARLVGDLISFLRGTEIRLTLAILGEGIRDSGIASIEKTFGPHFKKLTLVSLIPAPAVQVVFTEVFDDDAFILSKQEQLREGNFRVPLATAYVASKHHPAYCCSLYLAEGPPETTLLEYLKNMSHLSWLSVKPGAEKRTISYPPHICALLRKNHSETLVVNRFEFLPSKEFV